MSCVYKKIGYLKVVPRFNIRKSSRTNDIGNHTYVHTSSYPLPYGSSASLGSEIRKPQMGSYEYLHALRLHLKPWVREKSHMQGCLLILQVCTYMPYGIDKREPTVRIRTLGSGINPHAGLLT